MCCCYVGCKQNSPKLQLILLRLNNSKCIRRTNVKCTPQNELDTESVPAPAQDLQSMRIQLNWQLHTSVNLFELLQLIQHGRSYMNQVNVSTAAKTAAHIINNPDNVRTDEQCQTAATVYEILLKLIEEQVHLMGPQSIGNCMWSIGKLVDVFDVDTVSQYFRRVYRKLVGKACVMCGDMHAQEIANSLWSMAKVKWNAKHQFQQLINAGLQIDGEQFKAQEVTNILWACATSQFEKITVIAVFVGYAKRRLNQMQKNEISNLLWALQQLRFKDDELLRRIEETLLQQQLQFSSQEAGNLALGFAQLGIQNKRPILIFLTKQVLTSVKTEIQDYVNFVYALAVLECDPQLPQLVINKLIRIVKSDFRTQFRDLDYRQLRRAQLFYASLGLQLSYPSELQKLCIEEKKLEAYQDALKQNSLLDKVFAIVRQIFPGAVRRPLILGDELEVHIQISRFATKVAVQILTMRNYTINQPYLILRSTISFYEMLERFGWKVVEVSTLQWDDPSYQMNVINRIEVALLS
eukprot:TRINITY_DN2058_c0_g1_i5.p1 TRINITY_DN2058_c0_g1~~TRINITY_DN2058_c0_g1_i5.p1  ORF type:complete len:574 (-),score=68.23 TRINITY_DN2058_c0_g1_i5:176-1741(-)